MTNARTPIQRLLRPYSIAIAGVSAKPGSLGTIVLDNLDRFGFAGPLHLVHPTHAEVRGHRCVPSFADLPEGVDCVVLAIPVAGILPAVRACSLRSVGGIVIFAAGFAELGEEGLALQNEIAVLARDSGMAIEGPNCLGFVNYADGVALTFAVTEPHAVGDDGIAIVSQSGAMASVVRAALHGRGLDVSLSVSTGNEAANGIEDFLDHLLDDGRARLVAMVAEHIRQPKRFLELARRAASRNVTLVMLHPGRSAAAREAATTHTGALTGDHAVMRAHVERAGVVLAETLEELTDLCDILVRCAHRPRGGVAVLGESGAFKAMMLDYAEAIGVALPQPEGEAQTALNAIAPGFIIASNPLDLTAQALIDPTLYGQAIGYLLANEACGSLLVTIILTSAQMARRKMPAVIAAMQDAAATHAVVFAMLGEDTPVDEAIVAEVRAIGVPFFRSPERALRALARAAVRAEVPPGVDSVAAAARLPTGVIPEYLAKDILAGAGLPTPARQLVHDSGQAVVAAKALGYPVAIKFQSPGLPHKSEAGGVILNISDDVALRAACERLLAAVTHYAPGIVADGILVEPMAPSGVELILGARNDPEWGPVVVIGLGGVAAELLQDVRVLTCDLTISEIEAEIGQLKGAALLEAFRGRSPRDLTAIAKAVASIATFMLAHPEVMELDVNPLLVFKEGKGVLALDALLRVA